MDLNLRGKRALITGASKGIGAATAEALAEEGCHLHLAARSRGALEERAEHLRATHGVEVVTHAVDLRLSTDITGLVEAAPDIDILINNAGDISLGTLDAVNEEKWRHGWELKVFGYINLTRLVYARMRTRGHGVIVNNIGVAGEQFNFEYIAGSTGNAALMAFTRALGGKSLKQDNIRVVGVNPGPVETERVIAVMKNVAHRQLGDENRHHELTADMPLGRPAKPREIADMLAFLASDRSAYTTGTIITIDGGISATAP